MKFQLKHDFPLRYKWGSKSHIEYPFSKMLIGESFLAPKEIAPKVRVATRAYQKKNPKTEFSAKMVVEGIRVWRIA